VYRTAAAHAVAIGVSTDSRPDDYLQILNLHYLCEPKASAAWTKYCTIQPTYQEKPDSKASFYWLAWGDAVPQALLINAAPTINAIPPEYTVFYYDSSSKSVSDDVQRLYFPMHPRGGAGWARKHHPDYIKLLAKEMAKHLP
jgi:hypothetical protein